MFWQKKIDFLLHFCIHFGQVGNFTKFDYFPLQECVNKRILLWNEPQIAADQFDNVKMLFGDDAMNVRVKYQQDAIVLRTPVIVK